jgi:hypothetical protein
MAQNRSTPALTTTTTTPGAELLQAQAELWCNMFGFIKSMALQCAIKLGIPNTISRHGGAASLSELCAALPVAPSKRTCLSRLMKLLATLGIFREEEETTQGGEEEGSYTFPASSSTTTTALVAIHAYLRSSPSLPCRSMS